MSTLGGDTHGQGTRASQDETSPFLLEFMVASPLGRASQDETAPFPLEFEVLARKGRGRDNQDETSPFPLEFAVVLPDGEVATARAPRPVRAAADALPRLRFRGIEASEELRQYAARVASGEELPPFRGPLLANGASPWAAASPPAPRVVETARAPESRRVATRPPPERGASPAHAAPETASSGASILKLLLGLVVLSAGVVASAMLGDDAELRAAGRTISSWFSGGNPLQNLPAPGARNAPCETSASAAHR